MDFASFGPSDCLALGVSLMVTPTMINHVGSLNQQQAIPLNSEPEGRTLRASPASVIKMYTKID